MGTTNGAPPTQAAPRPLRPISENLSAYLPGTPTKFLSRPRSWVSLVSIWRPPPPWPAPTTPAHTQLMPSISPLHSQVKELR